MKIIAIVSQKGGTGKSTTAGTLAQLYAEKYDFVAIADVDPQGSLAKWHTRREKAGIEDMQFVELDINNIKGSFDYLRNETPCEILIVDTLPVSSAYVDEVIDASDFVVIPTKASLSDMETVPAILAKVVDRKIPRGFVLNEVKKNTNVEKDAKLVANSLKQNGLKILAEIPSSVQIVEAWAYGKTILEFNSSNSSCVHYVELFNKVEELTATQIKKSA